MSKEYLEAWNFIKEQMPYFTHSHLFTEMRENSDIVDNALQHLESLDNANPSEALKQLGDISYFIMEAYSDHEPLKENQRDSKQCFMDYCKNIQQVLIKAQELKSENNVLLEENNDLYVELTFAEKQYKELIECAKQQKKALEIIKERQVNIALLVTVKDVEEYNFYIPYVEHEKYLTPEEFELLKRYFK